MDIEYSESYIKTILSEVKTIAVVGASSKKDRDSFKVMYHLIENGYKVFAITKTNSIKLNKLLKKYKNSLKVYYIDLNEIAETRKIISSIIKNNNIDDYDFVVGPLTNDLFDYFVSSVPLSDTKIIRTLGKKSITSKNVINTIPHESIYFNAVIEKVKNDTLESSKFIISDSKVFASEAINLISELENSYIRCESLSIDINETKKNIARLKTLLKGKINA